MTKIYESPDGGKTVYQREIGKLERTLIKNDGILDLEDHRLWNEIRRVAKTNPALQQACERVKLIYRLTVDDPK